jgi:hypothetical protein
MASSRFGARGFMTMMPDEAVVAGRLPVSGNPLVSACYLCQELFIQERDMNRTTTAYQTARSEAERPMSLRLVGGMLAVAFVVGTFGVYVLAAQRDSLVNRMENAAALASSTVDANFGQIEIGMTFEEVERLMGPAQQNATKADKRQLEWRSPLDQRGPVYYILVEEGKVSAKGSEVR